MSIKSRKFDIDIVANELVKASVEEKNSLLFALLKDLIRADKKKEYLKTIDRVLLSPEDYVNKYHKDMEDKYKSFILKMLDIIQM